MPRNNYDLPFYLFCDSSRVTIGACLTQGKERIIDFFSRKLKAVEQRYPIHTLEAFAIVESILHFRRVLLGVNFTVYTDHSALERWFLKNPLTEKHAQMIAKLQDFHFVIKYIRGVDNVLADFASRPPNAGISTFDELRREIDAASIHAVMRVDLKTLIREHLEDGFPENDTRIKAKRITKKDDIYWYSPKDGDDTVMLIPPSLRTKLIADVHN